MIVYDRKKKPIGMLSPDGGLAAFRNNTFEPDARAENESPMCSSGFIALKNAFRWLFFAQSITLIGFFVEVDVLIPRGEIMAPFIAFGIQTAGLIVLALIWRKAFPLLFFALCQAFCFGLLRHMISYYEGIKWWQTNLAAVTVILILLFWASEAAELILLRSCFEKALTESGISEYPHKVKRTSFMQVIGITCVFAFAMYSVIAMILFTEFGAGTFLDEIMERGVRYSGISSENAPIIISAIAFRTAETFQLFFAQFYLTKKEKELKTKHEAI